MKKLALSIPLLASILSTGCLDSTPKSDSSALKGVETIEFTQMDRKWWHDSVVYEIWPRSFYDADGDGHGDFKGMTAKLDYLNDLGIDAIWLTPIFEAPSYHGYDYTEFYQVESDYGSMEDFDEFLANSKQKNIKIVLDLVINHISNEHPWFIKSAAKEAGYEDYFVWRDDKPAGYGHAWGDTPNPDAVWHYHEGRKQYYYGAFGASQPDVNLRHPEVKEEINKMATFWLKKGVEGFRLDAIRYAIETGPLAGQADTKETVDYWRDFTAHVKSISPDAFLVGEVWAPMEKVAKYYDEGKGIDTAFDFDFGFVVTDALKTVELDRETNFGESSAKATGRRSILLNNLKERANSGAAIDFYSPFLTNHDQNRISHNLGGDLTRAKTAAALVMTSPGAAPYLYYGEEVGMFQAKVGDDIYKRSIMQWEDSDTAGFNTTGKRWADEGKWTPWINNFQPWWSQFWNGVENRSAYTVAGQVNDPNSLFNLYKKLIEIRKSEVIFAAPDKVHLHPSQDNVWIAEYVKGEKTRWVILNLSADTEEEVAVPVALRGTHKDLITGEAIKFEDKMKLEKGQINLI